MGRFFEIPVYRVHRYISIRSHKWEKVRIDYAIFRWERKTDGGNKKVMIQSTLAGHNGGNVKNEDRRKWKDLRRGLLSSSPIFPTENAFGSYPVPAHFTHFFLLYLRYRYMLRTLILQKTLREQTLFECFSVSNTLHIQCMVGAWAHFIVSGGTATRILSDS